MALISSVKSQTILLIAPPDIQELAQRYQIKNQKLIEKIKQMMQAILRDSTQKSQ
ncbi:hypothetical protein [Helicobacter kayseriensis]|uniref:hypothetical protein n=1 Tax=Helicobacter kayseriensis TaxID=2905877 RepID=UPI001E512B59|nr:hypothetical protein [Helicobacter kayseriensis]MCE3046472.1 hypothetical protein [Helicobacter kayseriensis]MCE3048225.1 hypothetical protein [Helicobacter kayseriensis]